MYSPLSKILKDYKEGKTEHWETHDKILRLFDVEDYESKHLNISDVKKPIIIDTNKVIRVKPRILKQGWGSLFC